MISYLFQMIPRSRKSKSLQSQYGQLKNNFISCKANKKYVPISVKKENIYRQINTQFRQGKVLSMELDQRSKSMFNKNCRKPSLEKFSKFSLFCISTNIVVINLTSYSNENQANSVLTLSASGYRYVDGKFHP